MSLPLNPTPNPEDLLPPAPAAVEPAPVASVEAPQVAPAEPVLITAVEPPPPRFPAWSAWDILAVLVFTVVAIFLFSIVAMFVARALPAYHGLPFTELATKVATNAEVIVGAQAVAYLFVLLFIYLLVRSRSDAPFGEAIRWNWPGSRAPAFLLGGVVLALAVDGLSRYMPIPKSLPMDNFFTDAASAYIMAIFGLTLAPLLEELFFRGLLYPLLRRNTAAAVSLPLAVLASATIASAWAGHAWNRVLTILSILTVFALGAAFAGLLYPMLRWTTGLMALLVSTTLVVIAGRAAWAGHAWNPILTILSVFSIFALGAAIAALLYSPLRRATRLGISIASTALAFAGIHGAQLGYAWAPILSIFVVGVVFTVVRERLNSVAASFLMHCGYNFTLFSALWWASDHFRHLEKAAG